MRFESWQEMYDFVVAGHDLWSPEMGTYAFAYNDRGALATYNIDAQEASKLNESCTEYWGAMLGPGGYILDADEYRSVDTERYLAPSHEFCKAFFDVEWVECEDKAAINAAVAAALGEAGSAEYEYTIAVNINELDESGEVVGCDSAFLNRNPLGKLYLDIAEGLFFSENELEMAVEKAKELAKADVEMWPGNGRRHALLWVEKFKVSDEGTADFGPVEGTEIKVA